MNSLARSSTLGTVHPLMMELIAVYVYRGTINTVGEPRIEKIYCPPESPHLCTLAELHKTGLERVV